ncbi:MULTISPECIES: UBP-type zinc finger domain-containing protein [unclassified Streptomyces]|uniref:UBP-type zinc finger domain-containing protein n=1 Tax=unclassified Streptomyces TaxID=2593676 RepID=UPI0021C66211|nr:UBP-type zinc finger domain-containing protein [Streptomyces sp. FIT100]UUN29110.1 UBP-type zinc finger domain-containing protein [Streptomyces sp. FIT100]
MSECPHVLDLPHPEPAQLSETCRDCLADGTHPVQLRICLTCGHVGCCDSSAHRHASRHAEGTGHPVMRTLEPGESWRWCFVDGSIV